ncbi:hypothetical protein PV783_17315 [Chitinophaga sp. CC14]|uniref:hypothetical protein n=1 Tax=Chitinophaga sp. CC14 TaxID=3029199 RepID=UPI003B7B44D1
MKTLSFIVAAILFISCGSKKLTREHAAELIKAKYPVTIDWDIYTADPDHAARALDTKLEQEGYITLKRKQTLAEMGTPFIFFTDKAKPYLMETPEKDKKIMVQKVKLAEQHFGEITGMQMLKNDKKAIVEYTYVYKNVTPFVAISNLKIEPKESRKAYFALYDDGWRIVDKPDLDFLVE